jgi:hypothetical protein
VLCTDYAELLDQIRPFRRWVPQLVKPDDLTSDRLVHALTECIWELDVGFKPDRRPWRAQVLVDDVAEGRLYLEVPAWDSRVIPFEARWLDPKTRAAITAGVRCHARVNLGAESLDDIYLDEWEIDGVE